MDTSTTAPDAPTPQPTNQNVMVTPDDNANNNNVSQAQILGLQKDLQQMREKVTSVEKTNEILMDLVSKQSKDNARTLKKTETIITRMDAKDEGMGWVYRLVNQRQLALHEMAQQSW